MTYIKSYLLKKYSSKKNVFYINLDDYKDDKIVVNLIREKFGFAKSSNVKLLLKLYGERKCPQSFKDANKVKLAINEDSGIVFLENESKEAVVLNNNEDGLIEIDNS